MRKLASFYFFKRKPIVLKDRHERWRGVADLLGFTTQERLRVEWIVFYHTATKENATLTAQHFGISRKAFLVNQPIENLQTDNGSEFALEFEKATTVVSQHKHLTFFQDGFIMRLSRGAKESP